MYINVCMPVDRMGKAIKSISNNEINCVHWNGELHKVSGALCQHQQIQKHQADTATAASVAQQPADIWHSVRKVYNSWGKCENSQKICVCKS